MCPSDTSPEAWEVFLDIQRRTSPGEKLARVFGLSEEARILAKDILRRKHPEAGGHEILLRYARTTLGDDLFGGLMGTCSSTSQRTL